MLFVPFYCFIPLSIYLLMLCALQGSKYNVPFLFVYLRFFSLFLLMLVGCFFGFYFPVTLRLSNTLNHMCQLDLHIYHLDYHINH